MLGVYAATFDTVEAHATYRRLPGAPALAKWAAAVPPDFRFAPKAHMGITHRRDLDGVEDRVAAFVAALGPLGPLVGPSLFSLPHQEPDLVRLGRILDALPSGTASAFELGPAWAIPAVLDRLDGAGATLVAVDSEDIPAAGPLAYVRLRRGAYTPADLDLWADRLAKVTADGRHAYVFLKHDDEATGPALARELGARFGG